MARSQRRRSHTVHMPAMPVLRPNLESVLTNDPNVPQYMIRPLCGDKYIYEFVREKKIPERFHYSEYQNFTDDPMDHRICSQCQSKALQKLYGGKLDNLEIGARVDLSAAEFKYDYRTNHEPRWNVSSSYWKSLYPVYDNNIVSDVEDERIVAFIGIENGWGKAWEIRGWRAYNDRLAIDGGPARKTNVSEAFTSLGGKEYPRRETLVDAKTISSKEAALMFIPDMMARKQLRTYAEIKQAIAIEVEARRVQVEQREREMSEFQRRTEEAKTKKAADLRHVAEALKSIFDDVEINNFEREGLAIAARMLGIAIEGHSVEAA